MLVGWGCLESREAWIADWGKWLLELISTDWLTVVMIQTALTWNATVEKEEVETMYIGIDSSNIREKWMDWSFMHRFKKEYGKGPCCVLDVM
jgi:hypothetical protein